MGNKTITDRLETHEIKISQREIGKKIVAEPNAAPDSSDSAQR